MRAFGAASYAYIHSAAAGRYGKTISQPFIVALLTICSSPQRAT